MKNSKFNSLFEAAYGRYAQGNGFLVGDVVKLKSGYENMDGFKKLGENVKQRIKEAVKAGNNLRVGKLHNYSAGSRYSAEGADQVPAELADVYEEYAPGMVANLITLPVECLEEVDTGANLAPVPEGQKDTRDRTAEGEKEFKSKATNEQTKVMKKQTHAEKGDYELATKNTKLAHSNKHNDMQPPKVKGMQKAKNINESQVLLEDLYLSVLTEDVGVMSGGDAGAQQDEESEMEETFHVQDGETVLMSRTALPQTGDYLPAGTPAWVYYMVRQATPEQIKALMGNVHSSVPGGYGSYKDDSMLPRGLRGKTPGVEDEGNEFTGDLAHTQKGDKFKIGGKTVTNTTGQIAEEVCPICGKDVCKCNTMEEAEMKMKDESGLQAYLGKKKYGAADFKALQQAGREHDEKKKEQIKDKHSHSKS